MSFEFIPYDWVEDEVEDTVTLRSAKLEAVAFCVTEPAYLETDSYASFRKRNIDLEKLSEAIDEGKVTEDVKKLAKTLNDLIAKEEERVKEEEAKEKEKQEKESEVKPEAELEEIKEQPKVEEKAKEEKAKEEEKPENKEQPKVEEKAVEKEQSADTPNNDTKTETEVDEEYKKKLEQLKDLEKELSTVLESM